MGFFLARAVQFLVQVYVLVIIIDVVLGYILSPYHRVREFFDRLVYPLLQPIRRVVPPLGVFDLSPLILLLLVQLVGSILSSIFYQLP